MNALNTPLEALAFNYPNFAFSTAVWTWLAVITAAASFWKIRAAGCGGGGGPAESQHPDRRINEPITAVSTTTTAVSFTLEADCSANEGRKRLRRGKCTVYYDESDGVSTANDGGEGCFWGGRWERGLRMRVGEEKLLGPNWVPRDDIHRRSEPYKYVLELDGPYLGEDLSLGLYRYQDLTVTNGNVVRLWDWEFNKLVLSR